jgi:hypothetical protein
MVNLSFAPQKGNFHLEYVAMLTSTRLTFFMYKNMFLSYI